MAVPSVFHPPEDKTISFSIVSSPTAQSFGSGALFFQIQAPTTVQWVALAQGEQMAGANMFVIYTSSNPNNVTVSPRSAPGHVPPEFKPESQISLLSGTGVQDGIMTANIRCETCLQGDHGMNADSTASKWIWAYKSGEPMDTDNSAAEIEYHDSYGGVEVDLNTARTEPSSSDPDYNPFVGVEKTEGNEASASTEAMPPMAIAHGTLMAIAFVLLFPIFALLVPLSVIVPISVTKVHAPLQSFALAVTITGLGLGAKLWASNGATAAAHPIIGIIVVGCLCLFQPALGWLQHMHFRRTGGKSMFAYTHRWLGRGSITLGIINGGLGFWWIGAESAPGPLRAGMIAYSVIAGVMFLVYVGVYIGILLRTPKDQEQGDGIIGRNRISPSNSDNLILETETMGMEDQPQTEGRKEKL